jgi:hypothetical protein
MKALALGSALIIGSCIGGSAISAQTTADPFTLKLATVGSQYEAGAKVWVEITQTNTSDRNISCSSWWVGSSNLTYEYDIRDGDGKALEERAHAATAPGSFSTCELQSGQTQDGHYLLSWLYDLSKPGTYTVRVARRVANESPDHVRSNVITIRIAK